MADENWSMWPVTLPKWRGMAGIRASNKFTVQMEVMKVFNLREAMGIGLTEYREIIDQDFSSQFLEDVETVSIVPLEFKGRFFRLECMADYAGNSFVMNLFHGPSEQQIDAAAQLLKRALICDRDEAIRLIDEANPRGAKVVYRMAIADENERKAIDREIARMQNNINITHYVRLARTIMEGI